MNDSEFQGPSTSNALLLGDETFQFVVDGSEEFTFTHWYTDTGTPDVPYDPISDPDGAKEIYFPFPQEITPASGYSYNASAQNYGNFGELVNLLSGGSYTQGYFISGPSTFLTSAFQEPYDDIDFPSLITDIRLTILDFQGNGDQLVNYKIEYYNNPSVPEPATFLLLGTGLIGLGFAGHRLRRK